MGGAHTAPCCCTWVVHILLPAAPSLGVILLFPAPSLGVILLFLAVSVYPGRQRGVPAARCPRGHLPVSLLVSTFNTCGLVSSVLFVSFVSSEHSVTFCQFYAFLSLSDIPEG